MWSGWACDEKPYSVVMVQPWATSERDGSMGGRGDSHWSASYWTSAWLHERVHGIIDRRGSLRALVALAGVPLPLSAILSNKRAVLVELSVSSIPVVN